MSGENTISVKPPILSEKVKYLTTFAIFLECISFGCAFNFFSPVLVDLKNKYDTDIDSISKIFIIITIAYLCGSVAGGLMYNKCIKRQQGVILAFIGISLSLLITPYCSTIKYLFICVGVLGFCCGAYDTAQTVWIMEMWQSKSGPYIQAQHFCFALGSNLPPLLTSPFLSNHNKELKDYPNMTNYNYTTIFQEQDYNYDLIPKAYESNMQIPFTISAALAMANVLLEIFLIIWYPYTAPERESDTEKVFQDGKQGVSCEESGTVTSAGESFTNSTTNNNEALALDKSIPQQSSKYHKIKLIAISGLFLGFYQGMEMCSIQFIPTLAQYGDLKLSETEGAFALFGLTGAFALGRALGIIISFKIPPIFILSANVVLVSAGNVILMFWANTSKELLWAGCVTLGFGFSTMYASFCAFMERNLVFTDFVGSVLLVSGSIVGIIYPMIVGKYLEENPQVLTYTNWFSIIACTATFVTACCITMRHNKNKIQI